MVLVLGRNRPIERGLLVEQRRQIVTTSHPSNISEPRPGRNLGQAALPDGPRGHPLIGKSEHVTLPVTRCPAT
jgi:hypothetical protein